MFIVIENAEYVDGAHTTQLCGTFNGFEEAHKLMYELYHGELDSDDEYDEDCCEVQDDFAIVSGEGGFPRTLSWFVFDSDNPIQIRW